MTPRRTFHFHDPIFVRALPIVVRLPFRERGERPIAIQRVGVAFRHNGKNETAGLHDAHPFIERAQRIRQVFPNVRVQNKIHAVVRERKAFGIGGNVDRRNCATHRALHLFVIPVVQLVFLSGKTNRACL